MELKEQQIGGVFELIPAPHADARGFFQRTYDKAVFASRGLQTDWLQENHSKTIRKHVIRGLHLQLPPHAETKLVRCITGRVLDVFVDLRDGSETFGQYGGVELSAEKSNFIYIPRGFAHGFCTLTETSEVLYKVDAAYAPQAEAGLLWNDPDIRIKWPTRAPQLSAKDERNMTLQTFISTHGKIRL
jgi:dTDP-4-dehydrorhamnose 3,5-epimerase